MGAALLVATLMLTLGTALPAKDVHAQASGVVVDPTNLVENKISAVMSTISAAAQKSLGIKEWTLDGVMFALGKKVLKEMVRSTVDWINRGFKGSPMYATDPGQFLTDVADKTAGDIIYGSDLNFLCSPMSIRFALEFYYKQSKRLAPQCTLTKVVKNMDQFLNGNFMAGGWPGWLHMSITPTDQPLGGFLAARSSLDSEIARRVGLERDLLSWADGFFSYKECSDPKDEKTCRIMTPGKAISEALSFNLTVGDRVLIEADEINELVGALFAQLGNQALTNLRGVSGLSQSNYGSVYSSESSMYQQYTASGCASLSYLEQLDNPDCNIEIGATSTQSTSTSTSASLVSEALVDEREYKSLHTSVRTLANSVISDASARGLTCTVNQNVLEDAREVLNTAEDKIADADNNIADLLDIDNRYLYGDTEGQQLAVNDYIRLQGSGTLHTSITNVLERTRVTDTKNELEVLRARLKSCTDEDEADPVSRSDTSSLKLATILFLHSSPEETTGHISS